MTPHKLLCLLIEAGLKYRDGRKLLDLQQWSCGAVKLLEALDELGSVFGPFRGQDLFGASYVEKREWEGTIGHLHLAVEAARQRVKSTLGPDFDLPFDSEVVYQIVLAKAQSHFDTGIEWLRKANQQGCRRAFSERQKAITELKRARMFFGLCQTGLSFQNRVSLFNQDVRIVWLQVLNRLTILNYLPRKTRAVFLITIFSIAFVTTGPSSSLPDDPKVRFYIHCGNGSWFDADSQEFVVIPINDAVIIETNVSPRFVDTQKVTPVDPGTTTNDAREFLYSPGELGLDILDLSFSTTQGSDEFTTKSLFIKVVPEKEDGSCY